MRVNKVDDRLIARRQEPPIALVVLKDRLEQLPGIVAEQADVFSVVDLQRSLGDHDRLLSIEPLFVFIVVEDPGDRGLEEPPDKKIVHRKVAASLEVALALLVTRVEDPTTQRVTVNDLADQPFEARRTAPAGLAARFDPHQARPVGKRRRDRLFGKQIGRHGELHCEDTSLFSFFDGRKRSSFLVFDLFSLLFGASSLVGGRFLAHLGRETAEMVREETGGLIVDVPVADLFQNDHRERGEVD